MRIDSEALIDTFIFLQRIAEDNCAFIGLLSHTIILTINVEVLGVSIPMITETHMKLQYQV